MQINTLKLRVPPKAVLAAFEDLGASVAPAYRQNVVIDKWGLVDVYGAYI